MIIDKIVSMIKRQDFPQADRLDTQLLMKLKYPQQDYQNAMVLKRSIKQAREGFQDMAKEAYHRAAYLQIEIHKEKADKKLIFF